jgi:hypothetical protein
MVSSKVMGRVCRESFAEWANAPATLAAVKVRERVSVL